MLLDLGLPDLDGTEVIRRVRGFTELPIIVLSVRDGQHDKVAALDAGADDYVTKQFAMEELLARARAAMRRAQPGEPPAPTMRFGSLEIDLGRRLVQIGRAAGGERRADAGVVRTEQQGKEREANGPRD